MELNNEYFTEKIAPKKGNSNQNEKPAQNTKNPTSNQNKSQKPHNDKTHRRPAEPRKKLEKPEQPEKFEQPIVQNAVATHQVPKEQGNIEETTIHDNSTKMVDIIGVRFKDAGKIYNFSPNGFLFTRGDKVVVETARGIECGEVMIPNKQISESSIVMPLKAVIRKANASDIRNLENILAREKEIMKVFTEKIRLHKLEMKPIDVDITFDGSKILFYFTSDGRVDFRDLVKDLASIYRTRIELRQIGVRDEAKLLGGLGICGRPFCCSSFLGDFQPVSIKMAKEQSLSLNPTKISGTCGRLMCCLKYEQNCYDDFLKTTPKVGAYVETAEGRGTVEEANLLTGVLKIKLDKKPDVPLSVKKEEVKVIKDGKVQLNRDEIKALKSLEDK